MPHSDEEMEKGAVYPMMVVFENTSSVVTLKDSEIPCAVYQSEGTGRKRVAAYLDEFLCSGKERRSDLEKTVFIARDRLTGKVKIIEAACVKLKPEPKVISEDKVQLLDNSSLEVCRKFGSKKQKKRMETQIKHKVNESVVEVQMMNATGTVSEDQLDLSAYVKTDSDEFYIPPIDRAAEKVEYVYDIDKILTEEQYETIYTELADHDYASDFNPWIKNLVGSRKLTRKQTVLAVYANELIKLFSTLTKEINKKTFVVCQLSSTLNDIILTNFTTTVNGKRHRPTPYKDKTLCHAIVFGLLISNFKFEMEDLCHCTKFMPNTLSLKARVTGATIVSTGNKKMVQLKLPLNTKSSFRRKSAKF